MTVVDAGSTSPDPERLAVGRLDGRTILVTGAAQGLGLACARSAAAAGAQVVLLDADADAVERAASDLRGTGASASAARADVCSQDQVDAEVERILEDVGKLDGVVINAGIAGEGTAVGVEPEAWDRVLDVNLSGAWRTARAVLPSLIHRRSGSLVFQASVTALVGRPGIAPYAASKGGVVALTRQIACDVAPYGIRANAICPGTVMTPMATDAFVQRGLLDPHDQRAGLARLAAPYPLGRLGVGADVGDAAVFLLGDGAAWITGVALPVDGGLTSISSPTA